MDIDPEEAYSLLPPSPQVEAHMASHEIYRLPFIISVFWALAGCSSSGLSAGRNDRLNSVELSDSANPARCTLVPERLSVSRLPPAAVEDFLVKNNEEFPGLIKVERVLEIKGDCLDAIVGYQSVTNSAYLSDRRVLQVEPYLKLPSDHYTYVEPTLSSLPGPKTDPNFLMANWVASIQEKSGVAQILAGLWADAEGSTLRILRINANGQLDGSRMLLRSLRPVQSLRYLPTLHTEGGTLSLTIRQDDSLLLVRIDFNHPDWAATFGK